MAINNPATASSSPLQTTVARVLKPKYRRKLKSLGVQAQVLNEVEAQQLEDILASLAQANHQVTQRLDNIHLELQEMIAFSRAVRHAKEQAE